MYREERSKEFPDDICIQRATHSACDNYNLSILGVGPYNVSHKNLQRQLRTKLSSNQNVSYYLLIPSAVLVIVLKNRWRSSALFPALWKTPRTLLTILPLCMMTLRTLLLCLLPLLMSLFLWMKVWIKKLFLLLRLLFLLFLMRMKFEWSKWELQCTGYRSHVPCNLVCQYGRKRQVLRKTREKNQNL